MYSKGEMIHRYLATTVGVLIIVLTVGAWRQRLLAKKQKAPRARAESVVAHVHAVLGSVYKAHSVRGRAVEAVPRHRHPAPDRQLSAVDSVRAGRAQDAERHAS